MTDIDPLEAFKTGFSIVSGALSKKEQDKIRKYRMEANANAYDDKGKFSMPKFNAYLKARTSIDDVDAGHSAGMLAMKSWKPAGPTAPIFNAGEIGQNVPPTGEIRPMNPAVAPTFPSTSLNKPLIGGR